MYTYTHTHSQRGFSTFMAIGTIAVLLIIVSGLAVTYLREMKLSRTSYDEVVAYANAEGMFEYAMLKSRNHREGFADSVQNTEPDGKILVPTSARSKGVESSYVMEASSTGKTFILGQNEHLILPLFSGTSSLIGVSSKDPNPGIQVQKVQNLTIQGLTQNPNNLSWTIVTMNGSESVGLTGSGDVSSTKEGIIRHKASQCYSHNDGSAISCQLADFSQGDEEIQYFYDESKKVADFLMENTDPYLMVFNDSPSQQSIEVKSTTPFALPTLTVTAQAKKNDSLQVFRFSEDKSKYYDALKYGVYNDGN